MIAHSEKMLSLEQKHALSTFIHERFGLFFPVERHADLTRAVAQAAQESSFSDSVCYADWILSHELTDKQLEALVTNLTIGETYFFRDDRLFSGLRLQLFPQLLRCTGKDKSIRIWSAGCSTGEEPYSLAMLIDLCGQFASPADVQLYATDVNVKSLAKARRGIYSRWSFRGVTDEVKQRYFEKVDSYHWKLSDGVRERVDFSYLNLARPPFSVGSQAEQPFDIILCRNVLMYFSEQVRNQILAELSSMLADGGWLIVSPSESGLVNVSELQPVNIDGMVMHRKGGEGTDVTKPFAMPRKKPLVVKSSVITKNERVKLRPAKLSRQPEVVNKMSAVGPSLTTIKQQIDAGAYQEAITALSPYVEEAVSTRREQVEALLMLARCHANLGKADEAEDWVQKALQLDRLNASGQYLLAGIQQERNDLDAARLSLERALYLDSDYIMAHFSMGMLVAQLGEKQQSRKILERVKILLSRLSNDEIVPDSGGMTVDHLRAALSRF